MEPGVVCIWMPIPATLPVSVVPPALNVVDRKITRSEPSNIDSGVGDGVGISLSIKRCDEQSWFVRIWIVPGVSNEWVRRQLSFKQA